MNPNEKLPVVIIGAGMAGLSAAAELKKHKVPVCVVEARPRVGGRLWTDHSAGYSAEFGAQALHTPSKNPLAKKISRSPFKTIVTRYGDTALYSSEAELPEKELSEIQRLFSETLQHAVNHAKKLRPLSVLKALKKEGLDKVFRGREEEKDWALASAAIFSGEELGRLSIRFFEDAEEYDRPAWMVPAGLDSITEELAAKLEPQELRLNCPVRRVEWGKNQIRVVTERGLILARQVLVTLPLGVLKKGSVRFKPALPAKKIKAIQKLGFGILDLVHLEFPHVFWPAEHDFIGVLEEKKFTRFFNLYKHTGNPVLVAALGAQTARWVEKMPDQRIINEAMNALRATFGPDVPDPIRTHVTRWSKDPYALGSYSNLSTHAKPSDRQELARPVKGRLFFAGEATELENAGTLQGAFISGLREARHILHKIF